LSDYFGFTDDENKPPVVEEVVVDTRADQIVELVLKFLENLRGDIEVDTINWPGELRHQQIDTFIEKLQTVAGEQQNVTKSKTSKNRVNSNRRAPIGS
jgi:hypothetical protein